MLVLEMVPAPLADDITAATQNLATIGIGASVNCHGQVLVLHDMLGIYPGKQARFVRNFMEGASSIDDAIARYVKEVKRGLFPTPAHCY
jgi:3-methyl-2-oxobutanoate hydroxymethyltransferase